MESESACALACTDADADQNQVDSEPELVPTVYAPGDFGFVKSDDERTMLKDAWDAITATNSWAFMTQEPKHGYTFASDPALDAISAKMTYDGHSGYTYGWTMRVMQQIARIGWENFFNTTCLK